MAQELLASQERNRNSGEVSAVASAVRSPKPGTIWVLTIWLRCCRATFYTPSFVPCFTNMLLSPFSFESRLVVHLGVCCPKRRSPLVAILSVRTMAHTFRVIRLSNRLNSVSGRRKFPHRCSCDMIHRVRLFCVGVQDWRFAKISLPSMIRSNVSGDGSALIPLPASGPHLTVASYS